MSKEAMNPLVPLFLADGRAVFNINYRLLDQAPWPACREDAVAAGRFVLSGGLAEAGLPTPDKLLVCGASAGGHLSMMTGLGLPNEKVEAIISFCGPSRFDRLENRYSPELGAPDFLRKFFGREPSRELIAEASPALCVRAGAPPLFCIHSRNDTLVLPRHSEDAAAAWRAVGSTGEVLLFDGQEPAHGMWDSEDLSLRRVFVPADALLRMVLRRLN